MVTILVVLVAKAYVEDIVITTKDVSGAISVMAVCIHDSESLYAFLLKRGYSQGSTIEIAHAAVKVSAGMVVAKAGKNKGIINSSLPNFISCLDSTTGGL